MSPASPHGESSCWVNGGAVVAVFVEKHYPERVAFDMLRQVRNSESKPLTLIPTLRTLTPYTLQPQTSTLIPEP